MRRPVLLGVVLWLASCPGSRAFRVAIVGAGVGGSATAYELSATGGSDLDIDVYETHEIGGRTKAFTHDGQVLELGASIIHMKNRYARNYADTLNLTTSKVPSGGRFAVFDGKSLVFQESKWRAVTLYRMLLRYGLSYFLFRWGPSSMCTHFEGVYKLQEAGKWYETPADLLEALELYDLTQRSFRLEIQNRIGNDSAARRFTKELAAGVNRINYNQGTEVNAMAGMVSMLPTTDSRLFKFAGGNDQLSKHLLSQSGAKVHVKTSVTHVACTSYQKFMLTTEAKHGHVEHAGQYDAVVIATPLEFANISFSGCEMPDMPMRNYQSTVTTYVSGHLKPTFFNAAAADMSGVDVVAVSEDATTAFSSIGIAKKGKAGLENLYKLFSTSRLENDDLDKIFANWTHVAEHRWLAYPIFDPPERFAPFVLVDGLLYGNALESAASAIEIALVAARNNALAVREQYLRSKQEAASTCDNAALL